MANGKKRKESPLRVLTSTQGQTTPPPPSPRTTGVDDIVQPAVAARARTEQLSDLMSEQEAIKAGLRPEPPPAPAAPNNPSPADLRAAGQLDPSMRQRVEFGIQDAVAAAPTIPGFLKEMGGNVADAARNFSRSVLSPETVDTVVNSFKPYTQDPVKAFAADVNRLDEAIGLRAPNLQRATNRLGQTAADQTYAALGMANEGMSGVDAALGRYADTGSLRGSPTTVAAGGEEGTVDLTGVDTKYGFAAGDSARVLQQLQAGEEVSPIDQGIALTLQDEGLFTAQTDGSTAPAEPAAAAASAPAATTSPLQIYANEARTEFSDRPGPGLSPIELSNNLNVAPTGPGANFAGRRSLGAVAEGQPTQFLREGGGVREGGTFTINRRQPSISQLAAASGRRFGGGAAIGGVNNNRLRSDINRINRNAQQAFNDALKSGMNTKAASRIADTILGQADDLAFADRTNAFRYGDALRADAAANRLAADQQFRLLDTQLRNAGATAKQRGEARKQFFNDTVSFLDAEGNEYRDPQLASRVMSSLGLDNFENMSDAQLSYVSRHILPVARLAANYERLTGNTWTSLEDVFGAKGLLYGDVTLKDVFAPGSRINAGDYFQELFDQFGFGNAQTVVMKDGKRIRKDELMRGVTQTPSQRSERFRLDESR